MGEICIRCNCTYEYEHDECIINGSFVKCTNFNIEYTYTDLFVSVSPKEI